jgi:hypothetical protein
MVSDFKGTGRGGAKGEEYVGLGEGEISAGEG